MFSPKARSAVLAGLVLLLPPSVFAAFQASTSATLRGHVDDATGAVLPGATVTLTNSGTRAMQTTVTDDRGQYLFAGLFPSTYELKVELAGFKTYERTNLVLSPNDTRGLDVRLEIGQQTRRFSSRPHRK